MRIVAVCGLLLTAPAVADPVPPASAPKVLQTGPGATVRVVPKNQEAWLDAPAIAKDQASGAPAFGGGWAWGHVIEPPFHSDARQYPRGMVITPPDVGDANLIELGSTALGARLPSGSLAQRLSRALARGVDAMWDLMFSRSA